MANTHVGGTAIGGVYVGSTLIKKIYIGSTQVYPSGGRTLLAAYTDCGATANTVNAFVFSDYEIVVCGKGAMKDYTGSDSTIPWFDSYHTPMKKITIHEGITRVGRINFTGCRAVTSISLPSTLTSIGTYAFCYPNALTSLTLPANLTTIEYGAFWAAEVLPSITIPAKVTSIGDCAFRYNFKLTKVYFAGNPPTLTGKPFQDLTFTAYHKSGNTKWTSAIKTSTYGGATKVTWSTY